MDMYFRTGKVRETEDCKGVWVNAAIVELADGRTVTVDRDETEFTVDNGNVSMQWNNCYIWDGEQAEYNITEEMFEGARVKEIEVEDDADEEYDISFDPEDISFSGFETGDIER